VSADVCVIYMTFWEFVLQVRVKMCNAIGGRIETTKLPIDVGRKKCFVRDSA